MELKTGNTKPTSDSWDTASLIMVSNFSCDYFRFAAAFVDLGIDAWVMNVVPISGTNTLPVIFDRGLFGVMHDWYGCLPLSLAITNSCPYIPVTDRWKKCEAATVAFS